VPPAPVENPHQCRGKDHLDPPLHNYTIFYHVFLAILIECTFLSKQVLDLGFCIHFLQILEHLLFAADSCYRVQLLYLQRLLM